MQASGRTFLSLHAFLFFSLILVSVQISHGQTATAAMPISQVPAQNASQSGLPAKWNDAVKTLAGKIAAALKPSRAISLSVKNISSLSAADVDAIRSELESELRSRAMKVGTSHADVEVTLSENAEGYVWVAILRVEDEQVVMISRVAREAMSTGSARKTSLVLRRDLVWEQRSPLLDFLVVDLSPDGKPLMITLEPRQIVSYRGENGSWTADQTFHLPIPDQRPRDLRGRIESGAELFSFLLSDMTCDGGARRSLDLTCSKGSRDWPVYAGGEERGDAHLADGRNYFDEGFELYGYLDAEAPPFLSIALMNQKDSSSWILAELDGKSRLFQNSAKVAATFTGWGDDLISIATGCGGDWQVLVTGTGDWTEPDRLQAFEVQNSTSPVNVSAPLEFSGPILTLWASLDGKSARAVSRNLQTGMYEASIISATCGQ
jgi:hypothetical protein